MKLQRVNSIVQDTKILSFYRIIHYFDNRIYSVFEPIAF